MLIRLSGAAGFHKLTICQDGEKMSFQDFTCSQAVSMEEESVSPPQTKSLDVSKRKTVRSDQVAGC